MREDCTSGIGPVVRPAPSTDTSGHEVVEKRAVLYNKGAGIAKNGTTQATAAAAANAPLSSPPTTALTGRAVALP